MDGGAYADAMGIPVTFGQRLAERRKEKRMSQTDLGKGLGTDGKDCSKAVVSGWEKDQHHPRADQLAKICQALSTSADYLLFGMPAELSGEVASLASEIDAFKGKTRDRVLELVRQAVALGLTSRPAGQEVTEETEINALIK